MTTHVEEHRITDIATLEKVYGVASGPASVVERDDVLIGCTSKIT